MRIKTSETIITLKNIRDIQSLNNLSVISRARVIGSNTKPTYKLMNDLHIELSNKKVIHIPKGFVWDLSSVPRPLWGLLPPDGDFEFASIVHDFLYITKPEWSGQKFADQEMLKWSKAVSGTRNKWSIRNFDNQIRYIFVRIFGWIYYNIKAS